MEMHEVRYFLAVCDTLNFTRAAERCNVSQPSLTRAIQKLEGELGGLLFRRERAATHLTDLGQLVRPRLEQIAKEADTVKSTANSFLRMKDAPLSFGIMCTIGPLRCIGFLSRFHQGHPGVELSMSEDTPGRLIELLQEGKIDVAVMAQPDPYPDRFDVHPLYRENFVVAFPPGHRFEAMNAVRIRDVAGEATVAHQLRVLRPARRDLRQVQCAAQGRLSQRAGGLDPEHGDGGHGHILHA
jgi:DNA-binding transcriptional LysR family regulator